MLTRGSKRAHAEALVTWRAHISHLNADTLLMVFAHAAVDPDPQIQTNNLATLRLLYKGSAEHFAKLMCRYRVLSLITQINVKFISSTNTSSANVSTCILDNALYALYFVVESGTATMCLDAIKMIAHINRAKSPNDKLARIYDYQRAMIGRQHPLI